MQKPTKQELGADVVEILDDFVIKGTYGINATATSITTNFDIITKTGWYGNDTTYTIDGTTDWWLIHHIQNPGAPGYAKQLAFSLQQADKQYIRSQLNGVWTEWKRMLTKTDYDALFQYANDIKTKWANAVTLKGVAADPSETSDSLAAKTGQIPTGYAPGSKITIDKITSAIAFEFIVNKALPRTGATVLDYATDAAQNIYLFYYVNGTPVKYYVAVYDKDGNLLKDLLMPTLTGLNSTSYIAVYNDGFYLSASNTGYHQFDLNGNLIRSVNVTSATNTIACLADGTVFIIKQTGNSTDGYRYYIVKYMVDGTLVGNMTSIYSSRSGAINGKKAWLNHAGTKFAVVATVASSTYSTYVYDMVSDTLTNMVSSDYNSASTIRFNTNDDVYIVKSGINMIYVHSSNGVLLKTINVDFYTYPAFLPLFVIDAYGSLYHGGTTSSILCKTIDSASTMMFNENITFNANITNVDSIFMNKGTMVITNNTNIAMIKQSYTLL